MFTHSIRYFVYKFPGIGVYFVTNHLYDVEIKIQTFRVVCKI